MQLRIDWAEDLLRVPRPGLAALEDKLAWHDLACQCGVPRLPILARFGDGGSPWAPRELDEVLRASSGRRVCAKPAHLTTGHGIFIVEADGSCRMPEPTGPGAVDMGQWQRSLAEAGAGAVASTSDVAARLHALMEERAESRRNCRPLREVPPRAFVEDAVAEPMVEVRVLTVFGEAVAAASDAGAEETWPEVVRLASGTLRQAASRLAMHVGADLLRADFLVSAAEGRATLNEACAWLWKGDGFFSDSEYDLAYRRLMEGYRDATFDPRFVVRRVGDGVWACTESYAAVEGTVYQTQDVHFYIVEGAHTVAVIDAGLGRMSCVAAVQYALGGAPEKRVVAVLTHGHEDHRGGVGDLPVYAHRLEAPRLEGFSEEQITWVQDGDVLDLGGRTLRVLHTPGHTSGSISLLSEGELFVGDAFLDAAAGACVMFLAAPEDFARSLRRLSEEAAAGGLLAYPGHGLQAVPPERLRQAADACEELVKQGALRSTKADCLARGSHGGASWSWTEWDEELGGPVVQAGRDFAFVPLAVEHDK